MKKRLQRTIFYNSQQMNLSPKSDIREMYTKVPFPVNFKIYLFNLTNREETNRGEFN